MYGLNQQEIAINAIKQGYVVKGVFTKISSQDLQKENI